MKVLRFLMDHITALKMRSPRGALDSIIDDIPIHIHIHACRNATDKTGWFLKLLAM